MGASSGRAGTTVWYTLPYSREVDNPHNPYVVSMLKWRQIVGHVPLVTYPVSLWNYITITCIVTGNRRYSDLPQGGMEIPLPVWLTFCIDNIQLIIVTPAVSK